MLESIKTTGLVALLFTALMTVIALSSPIRADEASSKAVTALENVAPATITLAANFKANTKESRKQCNGQTTSECCKGLTKCSCLYMPGSTTNHPTACFSSKKTSSRPKG
jgi:hypothetical protein